MVGSPIAVVIDRPTETGEWTSTCTLRTDARTVTSSVRSAWGASRHDGASPAPSATMVPSRAPWLDLMTLSANRRGADERTENAVADSGSGPSVIKGRLQCCAQSYTH